MLELRLIYSSPLTHRDDDDYDLQSFNPATLNGSFVRLGENDVLLWSPNIPVRISRRKRKIRRLEYNEFIMDRAYDPE